VSARVVKASNRNALVGAVLAVSALVALPIFAFFFFGTSVDIGRPQTGSLQIVGSESMRPLVTACAESFMSTSPDADVIVRGGGSGEGISAVLHGLAEIGMSSRNLSQKERDYALANGLEFAVSELALDGIVVIVHPSNTVSGLDLLQIKGIYSGQITNWRDLAWVDREIVVYDRAPGSGTAALFAERVLDGKSSIGVDKELTTNDAIVEAVAGIPAAIGYTGLGAVRSAGDRVKTVAIRLDRHAPPVSATVEALRTGTYPLVRTLQLLNAGTLSDIARAFIAHCKGPDGQRLIQRAGYVGLEPGLP
jgi:phosphate transport system substrate-binding protein